MSYCGCRGVCKSCGTELESIQLTAEEYQQLRKRVMTDIIQGRDVFNKTTPEVSYIHRTDTVCHFYKHYSTIFTHGGFFNSRMALSSF